MAKTDSDKKIRALIVEDEHVAREKLKMLMSKFSDCKTVETGEDAIRSFSDSLHSKHYFNVVLLDIGLPDMNGKAILNKIHQLEKEKGVAPEDKTKIIMVTASAAGQALFGSIHDNCDDYLLKPVNEAILRDKLNAVGVL